VKGVAAMPDVCEGTLLYMQSPKKIVSVIFLPATAPISASGSPDWLIQEFNQPIR